jgi:hypothetical protein
MLVSPYRTVVRPLTAFIAWQARTAPSGTEVAVILPHQMHTAWWEWPLRRRVDDHMRAALAHTAAPVVVIDLPYTIGRAPR